MNQFDVSLDYPEGSTGAAVQQTETFLKNQHEVLRYIIDIGSSLRLHMDIDTLLKRVTEASCKALGFRYSVLYLSDGSGYFRACATSGDSPEEEEYLRQHPLPDTVVAQFISQEYRISESYFIPAEAPLWKNSDIASFFVAANEATILTLSLADQPPTAYWQREDLMIVPLVSGDNSLLGFLTPDIPLDGLRPTVETMALLELFANQAAVVIEGARLYEEARQSSEENARLNSELREALKQAQESERLKNHFLMTASHELRTPLTAVQGYLELLGSFGDVIDEDLKARFLNNARRACEELVLLLGNVMDTSRIDQDRVALNLGPVQVVKAVQLILEILEPTLAREGRPVEVEIADDLYVWVDELRLRQVLLNLVGNALKYTPAPSGIAITAACTNSTELNRRLSSARQQVFAGPSDQFVVIAIRDWGPGICPEDQSQLFTKFMRLDSAINSIQRGAGLGLYLCRQLVEAMGGCIWLESKGIAGEGSTFALALPLYKV